MADFSGLLLRRGPTLDRLSFYPLKGEIIYDSDNQTVYVGGLDENGEFKAGGLSVFGDRIKLSETIDYPGRENLDVLLNTQGGVRVPRGTTEERPPTEVTEQGEYAKGMIRFNVDTNEFEGYDGNQWGGIGGSGGGGDLSRDEVYFENPPEFPEIGDFWFENSLYGEIFVWNGETWISTVGGRTGQEINRIIAEINQKFGNIITQDNVGLALQDLITRSQLAESLRNRIDLIPNDPIERSEAVTIAEDGARDLLAAAALAYDAVQVWQFGEDTEDWLGESVVLSVDLPGILTLTPSSVSPRIYYNFKNNIDDVTDRGEWVAERNYVIDDVVTYAGVTYKCVTSHAAIVFQTALDLAYWEEFRFVNEEVNANAFKNISVKLKRKTGTNWSGKLYWDNGDGLNLNRSVQIDDPTITTSGTILDQYVIASFDLTETQTWTGNLKTIMLELGNFDDDVFDVDWIAIGNEAPADYYSAIQEEAFVRAEKDGLIGGQYTIKVDTGGYVTGFGLLATNNPLKQQQDSTFIVRAENFGVIRPNGVDGEETVPFVISRVNNTDVVAINGQLNVGASSRTLEQTQEEISSSGVEIGEFASDPNPSSYNIGDVYKNTTDGITYELGYNINGEKSWKIVTGVLSRSPSVFYKEISDFAWSDSKADEAISSAGQVKKRFDSVVLYNTTDAVDSNGKGRAFFTQKTWTGLSWETIELFVDGDAIVTGSLTADALSANTITGDKIAGNTISANELKLGDNTIIEDPATGGIKVGIITADEIASNTISANELKLGDNTIIEDPATGGIKVGNLSADQITSGTIDTNRLNVNEIIAVGGLVITNQLPTDVSDLNNDAGFITDSDLPSGNIVTENTIEQAIENAIASNSTIIDGATITTGTINVDNINLNGKITGASGTIEIEGDVISNSSITPNKLVAGTVILSFGKKFSLGDQGFQNNTSAIVYGETNDSGDIAVGGYNSATSGSGHAVGGATRASEGAVIGWNVPNFNTSTGVGSAVRSMGQLGTSLAGVDGRWGGNRYTEALFTKIATSGGLITATTLPGRQSAFDGNNHYEFQCGDMEEQRAADFMIKDSLSRVIGRVRLGDLPAQAGIIIGDTQSSVDVLRDIYLQGGSVFNFTGAHVGLGLHNNFIEGDIIIDCKIVDKVSLSLAISENEVSSEPYQKSVIGIVENIRDAQEYLSSNKERNRVVHVDEETGEKFLRFPDHEEDEMISTVPFNISDEYIALIKFNAVGEGQINVCGEGGNLEIGDYIVTSSIPGKGMKQNDDIYHNYTVAKSRENVTFSSPDEVKQIACVYLCG